MPEAGRGFHQFVNKRQNWELLFLVRMKSATISRILILIKQTL